MRNGGVGTISATANVNPAAIHELYEIRSAGQRTLQHKGAKLPPSSAAAGIRRLGAGPHSIAAEHGDQDLEHEQAKLNGARGVRAEVVFHDRGVETGGAITGKTRNGPGCGHRWSSSQPSRHGS